LITEILLQKTIAQNVNNIYGSFFRKYRNFLAIVKTGLTELQTDIKELGLSNKRAQILKDLSNLVIEEYDGKIPQDPKILRNINGIADYVSNAFACFGLNHRTLFYDVNIKRFIHRVFYPQGIKLKKEVIYEELDKLLPETKYKYAYWAILDHGFKICSKNNPKCELCPISINCLYHLNLK
jgi:adenine-specific DNA glycosylase